MKAPVEMPTLYVAQQTFEIQRVDYGAPEASGRVTGVQAGFPLWGASYTLGRMTVEYSDVWQAFGRSLRGATRRFIAHDLTRLYPREHPDGFAAFPGFDGTAASWSQSISGDGDAQLTLHLGASGADVILSQGDHIDFRYNATEDAVSGLAWRALVTVTAAATANGSGDLTVTVEPPVPSAVPSDAVAHIDQPGVVMALVVDQSSFGPKDRLYSINGGQIVGVQDLRS